MYNAGDYDEALVLAEQVVAKARASGKGEALATALGNRGSVLIALERYGEAEPDLREALSLSEKLRGRTDYKTLVALNNLAALHRRADKPAAALPLYEDLIARWSQSLGKDSTGWQVWVPQLATAYLDRAETRADLGQLQKGIDELMTVFVSVNIGVDDNETRATFLEGLSDLLEDGKQLAKLGSIQAMPGPSGIPSEEVPVAAFVSRSGALSEKTSSAVQRQEEVARRAYEAAGDNKNARLTGLRMPDWVMEQFDILMEKGKPDDAFAILGESVDLFAKQCEDICSDKVLYRKMLNYQAEEAATAGRADVRASALARIAELQAHSGSVWGYGPDTADSYHDLAEALDAAGRPDDAEVARLKSEVAEAGPDPVLGRNPELQLARKLRARNRTEQADAILRKAMQCGFTNDPDFFKSKLPGCEMTRFAMSEYAAVLEAQGKKSEAEFYRLPREVAAAFEGQDNAGARAKAERMLVLAGTLFKPEDLNYRISMAYFEAVHQWYDLPLFDIPKPYRLCGRWDEPEPPKPKPQNVPGQVMPAPMPMMSVAAPRNLSFYFNSTAKLTPLDPRGIFYHSMTNVAGNSLDRYVGQCMSAGRLDDAMRVADWAIAEANSRGYNGTERHRLMTTKARILLAQGDPRGAEQAYQEQLDVYLSKKDSPPLFSNDDIIQALVGLYVDSNRAESLQALVVRLAESGLVSNNPAAQLGLRESLFEIYLGQGDTDRAQRLLATLTPDRVKYDSGRSYTYQLTQDREEKDQGLEARRREAKFLTQVARLIAAQGQASEATALLEKIMVENATFIAGLKDSEPQERDLELSMLDAMPAAYLSQMRYARGDYAGAFEMLEKGLTFSKIIMDRLEKDPALLRQLSAVRQSTNLSADDKQVLTLFYNTRGAFAAAAEVGLRAGKTELAHQYFDRAMRLPAPDKPGLGELQVLWTSVGLGILEPQRRTTALGDARRLANTLAEQWRLRTRYPLDASATKFALQMGPQYFGDIAALGWAARAAGEPGIDEASVFDYVQRSLLDAVDMSIAGSIARAALVRTKPDAVKLLDERDEIVGTLLTNANVKIGYDSIEVGDSEAANRDADLYGKPRERRFGQKQSRLDMIDAQLRQAAPEYFAMTSTEPVSLSDAKALLKPEEAVLLAAPGRFGTQLMLLTSDGVEWRQSALTLDQVTVMTRRLRFSAGAEIETTLAERREWLAAVDGGQNGFDRKTAHALYQELLAPFAEKLAGRKQLFVAGGGPLTALPFAILVSKIAPGQDDDPQALRDTGWLGDDIALVQIPSLQSLALLRRAAAKANGGDTQFLGFGDPVLKGRDQDRGARRGAPATAPKVWRVEQGGTIVDVAQLQLLGRLPGTEKELREMAQALGAPASSLYLKQNASETAVKRAPLKGKSVLAFATHGLTTGQLSAFEPGLVMTPPAKATAEDDGLLTASEVAGLSLDADWVILSACNTASGDGKGGAPGLSGLVRAFFQAGARGMLVSHWPVRDDVAARLSVAAVKLQHDDPSLTKAEALRRAMHGIRMARTSDKKKRGKDGSMVQMSWAHPSAWAPFSLVSDGW